MFKIKSLNLVFFIILIISNKAFASLSVHPQKLVDTVYSGQNSSISIHVTNIGPSSSLGYQLSTSENWISLSTTSGNIKLNDSVLIDIKIETSKLKPGTNKANIIIGDPHHGPITVPIEIFVNSTTDVYESSEVNSLKLQAFPNPFYVSTQINYTLPTSQNVTIQLLDIQGSMIKLVANEFQTEGTHLLNFDGSDLPSGIYFITLNTPNYQIVKKLFLNK